MSDNPLAGLSIPSLKDIADQVMDRVGKDILDLRQPMQRERLRNFIQDAVGMACSMELERSLQAAANRAVTHVFRVMRDAEYQEKKRRHQKANAERRAAKRKQKEDAEREARMDYSRRNMTVKNPRVQ